MRTFLLVGLTLYVWGTAHSLECDQLSWVEQPFWYAGQIMVYSCETQGCSMLQCVEDLYSCSPQVPWTECASHTDCPSGQLCGDQMVPRLCVACDLPPDHDPLVTTVVKYDVIPNITEAMLRGSFWTFEDFYNHTGFDLVYTTYRWAWSLDHTALQYDFVRQHRHQWGEGNEMFVALSDTYANHNDSFTIVQHGNLYRDSFDSGGTNLESSSRREFLPKSFPPSIIPQSSRVPAIARHKIFQTVIL
mmetsp:Transcript_6865/g.19422  ORF Transcript_6865/g.19422 Transcript_6865/m.19422 type:complete len:246 (-) Transcript_6865:103-840(-)|eukprot:CAMPEP_0119125950 /NCGR_PEP_ID=MMETSP1310-20130426/5050_1 /TAXON_ID=464262 /ORGANISM="Genus nov. species nov., Strain RCC2339" /LENGTH=245 /DNA_ID=CAMNT_0007116071 /DNA_START=149 /DNA_END=886 /DNA_ORIENTATION=-